MEIIERGIPPGEREHEATCFACKTTFRFKQKEAHRESTCRNEEYLKVHCPVRRAIVWKEITFSR